MKIQEFVSDVKGRVQGAGKQYQGAFVAYMDAQKKALSVVARNGQTLAGTEIGAAKNVFAAARASFDKARRDGVRKVAAEPQAYVPNGRDQIISAYKDTIDLLVKTGNELTDVVFKGYESVRGKLNGKPARKTTSAKKPAAKRASTGTSTGAGKKSSTSTAASSAKPAARKTTAKRKSTAKPSGNQTSNQSAATAATTGTATTGAAKQRKTATTAADASSSTQ